MLSIQKIAIVFNKEWRDSLRDKRSLRMALLTPIYFVLIFVASSLFVIHMSSKSRATTQEPIDLPVMGAEHLPYLMTWLQERGITINYVTQDAYKQVEENQLPYALIVPHDAQEKYAQGESIELMLVFDVTNNKIQGQLGFVRQQIHAWSSRIGGLRLLSRSVSLSIAQPVIIRDLNIASEQKMGFFVIASLPMLLILIVFTGSIGFSADMTAGERERRSLESLLITPINSTALIFGKWLTSLSLTVIILLLELSLFAVAFAYIPFNQLGLKVDVNFLDLLNVFIVLFSLALIATGLQFSIAIFARSFKDAQTYMALMIFIPMVPLFYTLVNPSAYADWFRWVPVLGHQLLIKDILLDTPTHASYFFQLIFPSIVIAISLIAFTARQLRRPKTVYGI
jgi:sodium transport system permease protein